MKKLPIQAISITYVTDGDGVAGREIAARYVLIFHSIEIQCFGDKTLEGFGSIIRIDADIKLVIRAE
ncbi:MAG: hypothetical protein CVV45_15640 [Spirochaetae bacterium HGW-Spirochaetae-10]|nr:MAG: hypothetical protein CVV45_15640 [Spirochaetae bacterium HGW-Spirochaetae-10]